MLWLSRLRRSRAIDDVTNALDLKFWDNVYAEGKAVRRRYKIPLRWAMFLSVISTIITAMYEGEDDDVTS